MAMGKRQQRQEPLFILADGLPKSAGHPFYQKLNALLAEADFDRWIERRCQQYYEHEEKRGQPSLPPGVYFRMLLVGYFEGIDSQRGIAWRCADSLSLRQFLGIPLAETTPDPKTLSNTRRRLPEEVFDEVFQFVLGIAAEKRLISGKTVGVDSSTLEANAAMKSIVRRDTGEDWKQFVTRLMRDERYHSRWQDKPAALQRAVYANRRRLKRSKSRSFQRLRSERCERTFAHVCDTGGMRRSWLKEVVNVSKRYLIAAAAHNLGRIMRKLFGIGKPRTLQDLADLASVVQLLREWRSTCKSRWTSTTPPPSSRSTPALAA